jgi:hypothetical protein
MSYILGLFFKKSRGVSRHGGHPPPQNTPLFIHKEVFILEVLGFCPSRVSRLNDDGIVEKNYDTN